ncbi:MAG: hypothetical protein IJS57_02170 [Paludibacteraceae bacterium]|nr:hypothetical protein [Paludibacteraceae bacterium]
MKKINLQELKRDFIVTGGVSDLAVEICKTIIRAIKENETVVLESNSLLNEHFDGKLLFMLNLYLEMDDNKNLCNKLTVDDGSNFNDFYKDKQEEITQYKSSYETEMALNTEDAIKNLVDKTKPTLRPDYQGPGNTTTNAS